MTPAHSQLLDQIDLHARHPAIKARHVVLLSVDDAAAVTSFLSETVAQGLAKGWAGTKVVSLVALRFNIKPAAARNLLRSHGYINKSMRIRKILKRAWTLA